jgi:transcriptional regulator with XRE-family HTH domain
MPPSMPVERRALANAVRELRARERLSQEAVSDAAGLGRGFVGELETGRRRTSFEAVVGVADVLGLTMAELGQAFDAARAREKGEKGEKGDESAGSV